MDANRFRSMQGKASSDKGKKKQARPEQTPIFVDVGETSSLKETPSKRVRVSGESVEYEEARDTRKLFVPDWTTISEKDSVLSRGEKSMEFLRHGMPRSDFSKLHQMDVDLFDSSSMQAHLASAFYGYISMERRKLLERKLEEGQVIFGKMEKELNLAQSQYVALKSEFDKLGGELEASMQRDATLAARLEEANAVVKTQGEEVESLKDELTLYSVYSAQVGYNRGFLNWKELGLDADPSLGAFPDELLDEIAPEVNELVAKMKAATLAAWEGEARDEDEAEK